MATTDERPAEAPLSSLEGLRAMAEKMYYPTSNDVFNVGCALFMCERLDSIEISLRILLEEKMDLREVA